MKHTCKKRGTRGRSPGRKEKERRALKALAAAGAIAGGTQAYALPVRFDNPAHGEPGHFHWPVETPSTGRFLDLALGPGEQAGELSPSNVLQFIATGYAQVGRSGPGATADMQVGGPYNYFLVGVNAGETIPSGASWAESGLTYYSGYGSELPNGQATYLGVRFDLGSGWQYSWIGVVRTDLELEAFAWGHETEAGVPIAAGAESAADIPTVSEWGLAIMSLSLLAAGAWVVKKRIPQPKPPAAA